MWEICFWDKSCFIHFSKYNSWYFAILHFHEENKRINELTDFWCKVVTICQTAFWSDGNAAILDESGVSCEIAFNCELIIQYLREYIEYISLTDPNHNIRNGIGQMVVGSSPASIGDYVFCPYLLKLVCVKKELYSLKIGLVMLYHWHWFHMKLLTTFPLGAAIMWDICQHHCIFFILRLSSYSVHANSFVLAWLFSIASTLFFISLHHLPKSQMLPNRTNMQLETVDLIFLLPSADVSDS